MSISLGATCPIGLQIRQRGTTPNLLAADSGRAAQDDAILECVGSHPRHTGHVRQLYLLPSSCPVLANVMVKGTRARSTCTAGVFGRALGSDLSLKN